MKYFERKKQIIDLLKSNNGVSNIDNICKKIFVSRSTLRRDLITLEEEGIIKRHHGGISLIANSSSENSITRRRMENTDKKMIIAKLAKHLIQDNSVIFLDSSSTVSYIAPYLKAHDNITVITNGLNIASQLNNAQNIRCYICPGVLKNKSLSIIGEYTYMFLENFRADLVFLSSKSIRENGIFEGDDSQALCKKNMIKNSIQTVLLCDNTKEMASGYFKLADFTEIHTLVSNGAFSDSLMKSIYTSGCNIILP